MPIALKTNGVVKQFDAVRAVDGLSIEIPRGQITSIVGPNGSGKSTLVNVLTGMIPFESGEVAVDGTTLSKIKPFDVPKYSMTRTFQDVRLFEQMTVLDNVLIALTERNVFSAIFERHGDYHLNRAEEILRKMGIWEKRNELAANLSYGQRKLLEIGRVLAMDTETYLLDEPFAGLFPEMIKIIVGAIQELKEKKKTIVLIEHNMDLIRQLSDYVFVLDSGKLLAEGKPDEVLSKKEVIEAYLGE